MKNPVIVASGGANIASLQYALERLGSRPRLSADSKEIEAATHVILPGVGAAQDAMMRLDGAGLSSLIPQLSQPVLGICLGMQLLYESSEEQDARCIGVLPGRARRFEPASGRPVPHMGWNRLRALHDHPLLAGICDGDYAYFVHSYALTPSAETVAVSDYGADFSAVVSRGNFHGAQFHPERSAATGAKFLANFLGLS
ncbi:MAG: imidazole glycerol phosphate synthase subunit HisH [Gammaproteobacteria bacterium]|nr:imidazole glycerol phosphate synthase subunit HisH [Gammaproteobacteria bacterium]